MKLSRATGTPCVLTRVERDGSFVAIDKAEEAAELIVSVPIGHRFPPDAPAQMRVRLAWMAEDLRKQEMARWRPRAYTKTTIVRKKAAWAEIEATRRRGYSISRAEFSPGVMTLAVPIFDTFGDVQMVLQCPGLIDKVARRRSQARRRDPARRRATECDIRCLLRSAPEDPRAGLTEAAAKLPCYKAICPALGLDRASGRDW